jgi:hypothetical protein
MPGPNWSGVQVILDKVVIPALKAGHVGTVSAIQSQGNPVSDFVSNVGSVGVTLGGDSSVGRFMEGISVPFWARPDFHAAVVEHGPMAALEAHDVITSEGLATLTNILSHVGPLAVSPVTRAALPLAAQGAASGAGSFVGTTLSDPDFSVESSTSDSESRPVDSKFGGYGGSAGGTSQCDEAWRFYSEGLISWDDALKLCPSLRKE